MPAPIVAGLINYLTPALADYEGLADAVVWDGGETPRYSTDGTAIGPNNAVGAWPVVQLGMEEGSGFTCRNTFNDNVDERGMILVQVWSTTRAECEDFITAIWAIMSLQITMFTEVNLRGTPGNINYVVQCLLDTWWCGQDKEIRTAQSQLMYRGDMRFDTNIRTTTPSTV